ncbi:competence protein ComEA [Capsulimonas corticalis]|uniref:Competence protein ComEA n=1 Tax=Capsulimonas corticalis TaxID=2219043 RepID=A0A402CT69_9BACT|nr:helix-hairpin-helix domain-containing protein [Capsulimonas corticalis]BDI30831.1 competence protein ComEA [Capsulimonas corticalis]
MQDPRIRWALVAVIGVIACAGGANLYAKRHTPPAPITITDAPSAAPGGAPDVLSAAPTKTLTAVGSTTSILPSDLICYVHVAGAVRNPGLYHLPLPNRVANAIHAAGGGTSKADLDALNLAEPIADGEKIYVPERHEDPARIQHYTPGNSIGHTTIHVARAPRLPAASPLPAFGKAVPLPIDASAVAPSPSASAGDQAAGSEPAASSEEGAPTHAHASHPDKITAASGERININTASATDLERLPGVGPATAAHIIDYRTQNGGFHKIEDLMDVKGIGEKKLAKIAPFVTL